MAICWAAGKGLDLQRLATSRPSSYPGEKRASEASFIEVAEKKIQGLLESLRRVLKKLNVQQSEHFLEFLQNLLF